MGAERTTASSDSVQRLHRWGNAGGTWRIVSRSATAGITVALDSCHGEEMERFTSDDPLLAAFIGVRESSDGPLDPGPFFHGTKAELQPGDLLEAGRNSNYDEARAANFVYLTASMDAAVWGAELAVGEGRGHIYRVEPTGPFENDPNLTDAKFPGNPTRSYRTRKPLQILGEVEEWEGHAPEVLQHMLDSIEDLKRKGIRAIND